ncbi:MAG: hypothetical protein WAK01_18145, partial [Methylocystis sp.]
SPDTLAIAEIAHGSDIAIVQKLYARFPKFGANEPGLADRQYMREVDMGNDRDCFSDGRVGVPLYEGRMVAAFDHRAKAYVSGRARSSLWRELTFGAPEKAISPQWHISAVDIPNTVGDRWRQFRLGFCDVASPTNARTLVAALIPSGVVCGHSVPTIAFSPDDAALSLLWLAVANAMCSDYLARKKVSLHMTFSVLDSLPLPRCSEHTPIAQAIAARALTLTATGPEMEPFWRTTAPLVGLDLRSSTPCEDPAERERLQVELDVLVARDLFQLMRDEMRYLLEPADILGPDCNFDTFGPLRRNEERDYGEFRTRRLILETWDTLPLVTQETVPGVTR